MRLLKVKQATNISKGNSLFFKPKIKVSFVALNQIRNDSKNERDFKRIVFDQMDKFWIVAFNKIAHTPTHIVLLSSVCAPPRYIPCSDAN